MKSTVLWALVVLNVALLASFLSRLTPANTAHAQAPRRPGDYLMISGEVDGATAGLVYIVDTTNGLLSAIAYDDTAKRLVSMQKIDLMQIFSARGTGGAPAGNKNRPGGNR